MVGHGRPHSGGPLVHGGPMRPHVAKKSWIHSHPPDPPPVTCWLTYISITHRAAPTEHHRRFTVHHYIYIYHISHIYHYHPTWEPTSRAPTCLDMSRHVPDGLGG